MEWVALILQYVLLDDDELVELCIAPLMHFLELQISE